MKSKVTYVSIDEATRKMLETVEIKPNFEVIPAYHAYGRVLSDDIVSEKNIPPRNKSHVDGYAVRSEDTVDASKEKTAILKLKGKITLGDEAIYSLGKGETYEVSTGSYIPNGADAVVMIEVALRRNGTITVHNPLRPGDNVTPQGSDIKKGDVILKKDHIIRSTDLGLFEIFNINNLKVIRKPVVAILSIGDELARQVERTGKPTTSHSIIISKLVEESYGLPRELGVASDDVMEIRSRLEEGLATADIVLTIGGASIGEKDLVADTVSAIGGPGIVVHGIKVTPGRVSGLGVINAKPVVILPGLIQSTIVGFYVFAMPLIRLMAGVKTSSPHCVKALINKDVNFNRLIPFKHVTFVKLAEEKGKTLAEPLLGDSSMISVTIKADGFVLSPENTKFIKKGEEVNVLILHPLL